MFMHYIVRTLIFQQQYLMKACSQHVTGDKSKYLIYIHSWNTWMNKNICVFLDSSF